MAGRTTLWAVIRNEENVLQDRTEKDQWGQERWTDFNLQEAELQPSKARCTNLRTEMAKITGVKFVQLRC